MDPVSALAGPILGIIHEGMQIWKEERRARFMNKHHDILKDLKEAENATYPNYTDAAVNLSYERLRIFVEAYRRELREANLEIMQSRQGRTEEAP